MSFTELAQRNKGQLDVLMLRLSQRLQSHNLVTRNMAGLVLETVALLKAFVSCPPVSSPLKGRDQMHTETEAAKETDTETIEHSEGDAEQVQQSALEERDERVRMAAVGLFLCRSFCAAIIRYTHEEEQLALHFTPRDGGRTAAVDLLQALVQFLTVVPLTSSTYPLHREVENVLIVLLSTQLFSRPGTEANHLFYDELLTSDTLLPGQWRMLLVQQLLARFLDAKDAPSSPAKGTQTRGFLKSLGSAASTVLWAPLSKLFAEGPGGNALSLSQRSCLLLLLLCHKHNKKHQENRFLLALRSCQDSSSHSDRNALVPFPQLFDEICMSMEEGHSIGTVLLLLFDLLQEHSMFKAYLLSRSDITTLVVSLLQVLHTVVRQNSAHACDIVSLIASVLLVLSEDHGYHAACQRERLSAVPWFYEQTTADVSVSDLLCAVVLKAAHANLAKFRSRGLQMLLLAVVANHAPFFRGLESHTAYRLLALLEVVARRYGRARLACQAAGSAVTPELVDAEEMYAEILSLSLHILDLAVAYSLQWNPHLVYALLYSRETFLQLQRDNQMRGEVANIVQVIEFFDAELSMANLEEFSSAAVTTVIEEALMLRWDRGRKKGMGGEDRDGKKEWKEVENDMYIFEECSLEHFYLPYVWEIVVKRGRKIGGWSTSLLYPLFEGQEQPSISAEGADGTSSRGRSTSLKASPTHTPQLKYKVVSPPRGGPPGVYPPDTYVIDV